MKTLKLSTRVLLWILATVITLASVVYQRRTGPTYPVRGSLTLDGNAITYKLPRSQDSDKHAKIQIKTPNRYVTGTYSFKRYKSNDQWLTLPLSRGDGTLEATIPKQPPAGKVMYQITLIDQRATPHPLTTEPVVIRFKGPVPKTVLLPHIVIIFLAMLFGTRTGLEAIWNGAKAKRLAIQTAVLLAVGGLILGPIVQKFAFGAYWTGWPFGHDLTDNKTAVAFLFWMIALWQDRKGRGRPWYVAASVIQMLVYLVPHSVLGSELDYTKPK